METTENLKKWQEYQDKRDLIFDFGFQTGLIRTYNQEEFELMQNVYYGGVPASIILLCPNLCKGYCLDRTLLLSVVLEDTDFQLVTASIDGLSLNPEYQEKLKNNKAIAYHRFLERKLKNGTTWVYDTSEGLVFEKYLYYKMHNPQIKKVNNRENTRGYIEFQEIKNSNLEQDKNILPLIIPNIEEIIDKTESIYDDVLREEVKRFKEQIGYDELIKKYEFHRKEKMSNAKI